MYKFGFNGQLKDDEVYGNGNSYDFGARIYDPRIGRWLKTDKAESKYPAWSPYSFAFNGPITTIDPDGNENIVVVGAQYNSSKGSKLMFVNQALKTLKYYKTWDATESRSLVLFTAGYTEKQIARIKEVAEKKYGASVVTVNSSDELVNYINNKDAANSDNTSASSERSSDLVSSVDFFAHGVPGSIEFGYNIPEVVNQYRFSKDQANKLNPSAFSSSASIYSYACRTGLAESEAGNEIYYPWSSVDTKNSLAQVMSNVTGVTVYAYLKRTSYSSTLGNRSDRIKSYLGLNSGFDTWKANNEEINGAILNPEGAYRGVSTGDFPKGLINGKKKFEPETE